MRKPKRGPRRASGYWSSITDDALLAVELTTDDPESLENLVYEIPPGDEEPHVEFAYDLRGTDREKFRCVFENHPHLSGFIMNKGGLRFMVGRVCGQKIYGQDFTRYTTDFNAAQIRQDLLRRTRDVRAATDPFINWLEQVSKSMAFHYRSSIQEQIETRMPWLWQKLNWHSNYGGGKLDGETIGIPDGEIKLPRTLFDGFTDPHKQFRKASTEFASHALLLVTKMEINKNFEVTFARMQKLLKDIDAVLDQLNEVVQFFQPAMLAPICEWATYRDNPGKRKYEAGLGSITCRKDGSPMTVNLPKAYEVPSRAPITAIRSALASGLRNAQGNA